MEVPPDPLIAAARSGDATAAERLVGDHHARIFAFLRRLSGNDEDAADLTQRTFTRVWTSLDRFEGRSTVASWIHGIAHHVYLDWRRAERRGEPRTDDWWTACPDPRPGPADLAVSADLARATYAAVDRLAPDLRSVVHLHYYQGLTLQETADALGTSASTVKNRLRAALDRLQSLLVRRPNPHSPVQTHPQP